MSGQSTVLSTGGATVPSSGLYTAMGIQQVQGLLNANNVVEEVWGQNGIPPVPTVPAGAQGTYVLAVPNNTDVGSVSIPAGYGAVVLGQGTSGTVTGGGANTSVLSAGSVDYSGDAGAVTFSGGPAGAGSVGGSLMDNATGAVFDLGGGTYSVTAGGNQQTIQIDDGTNAAIAASGNGDTVRLGDPPGSATISAALRAAQAPVAPSNVTLTLTGQGAAVSVYSGNNLIVDNNGLGSNTISGVGGSSTVFAGNKDVYYGGGGVTEFLSSTGAQTVFGGTGNDTVFNTQGGNIVYAEGSGTSHVFVGGTGTSSIFGNGSGAVFGGTGRIALMLDRGQDVFVGQGGSDSIYGGSVMPTVFGNNNENVSIIGSHAAFEVALGNNGVYNASLSNGGNNFFAQSSTGNTTLTGAVSTAPTGDNFVLLNNGAVNAHTVTITNWHTGDGFFLGNYSQADIQTMDNAIGAGGSSFKLSDGTTVVFQGQHPMHTGGNAAY